MELLLNAPSAWLARWVHLLEPGSRVLDVACGSGRHLRWLAGLGHRVTGVDRDAAAVEPLRGLGEIVVADLEGGPWPFPQRRFDAVVVTNYLWRALLPTLVDSVDAGGLLLYETFADGQQHYGRPTRSEFLLQPGELLQAAAALHVVAYEDGVDVGEHGLRRVQRLVARRAGGPRGAAKIDRLCKDPS